MADRSETVATEETVRAHQLGQGGFRSILPDDIDWKPFAAFHPRSGWQSLSVSRRRKPPKR
jgi:hypothetical protein